MRGAKRVVLAIVLVFVACVFGVAIYLIVIGGVDKTCSAPSQNWDVFASVYCPIDNGISEALQ